MNYSVDSYHAMQDRVAALEDRVSERDTQIADLRAALAKAEAELRSVTTEWAELTIHHTEALAVQARLTAERDALKARAERAEADRVALMRAIDDVARFVVIRGMVSEEYYAANKRLHDARAAVDAAGDLEAKP